MSAADTPDDGVQTRALASKVVRVKPNTSISAAAVDLETQPVTPDQTLSGQPRTGVHTLTEFRDIEVGIWEMTPGTMSDVEADEVFVVLSGSATVEFGDGSPTISIGPGDVVRLAEGAETVWTVTETLRKVYLT
ncbi:MAG: cupin [Mycobacterium sp.]|nr:cupin [Mycobacterium sp.]